MVGLIITFIVITTLTPSITDKLRVLGREKQTTYIENNLPVA